MFIDSWLSLVTSLSCSIKLQLPERIGTLRIHDRRRDGTFDALEELERSCHVERRFHFRSLQIAVIPAARIYAIGGESLARARARARAAEIRA